MSEETWHAARLIPVSGISGSKEQEGRATSALLAVLSSVREFGRALTQPLGAPAAPVQAFIEVPFSLGDKKFYPDGLLKVVRGRKTWTALVEVKTGSSELRTEQLENYLEVAREQGFDALITISNEMPTMSGSHPTLIDKRKLRKVALHHWSWNHVLCEAVLQREHRGVVDADQAWILGELVRYLEHPRSGVMSFDDMGPAWVPVREAVMAGTLRPTDAIGEQVATRFGGLLQFAGLRLGRKVGGQVVPALPRKHLADPSAHVQHQVARLAGSGRLSGRIRIPGAVGLLEVVADLRASQVICHMDVEAPREGRPVTRVKWLLRQLRRAPDSVRLEAFASHSRGPGNSELLRDVRVTPSLLVAGHRRELRSFRVAAIYPMGSKRGIGRNSFIDSVLTAVDSFHRDVVKELKAWSAPAPRKDNATSGASEDPLAGSSMGTEDPREGCLQARAIDTAGSSISSTAEQGAGAGHDVAQVPAQRCGPTPIPEAVDAEVAAAQ